MTIFDYLKSILVTKDKNALCDQEYAPFMVNRWLSFLTPESAMTINDTVNTVYLEEKSFHYRTLLHLFPKLKYQPRIAYIKKTKGEKKKEDDTIGMMAKHMELSEREITMLIGVANSLSERN